MKFYLNFSTNDVFTPLTIKGYKLAKKNYNKLISKGFKEVTLSDHEGQVLLSQDQ